MRNFKSVKQDKHAAVLPLGTEKSVSANAKYYFLALLSLVCLNFQAFAQPGSGLVDEGYDVKGVWRSSLSEKNKPDLETPPVNNPVDTKGITYEEKDIKVKTEYEPLATKPPAPPKPPMKKLYNNFIRVGYGRFATPLADVYLNTGRNLKGQAGLDFSHISSSNTSPNNGYVDYAEFRDDRGGIKAEAYVNDHTIGAKLRLQNTNYFYFADTLVNERPDYKDSIRETFTRLAVELNLAKNYDPEGLNYDVGLTINGLFDNHKQVDKGKDIHVGIDPGMNWKITDNFFAAVTSNLVFSNTEFDSVQQSRFFLDFTPSVTFKLDRLQVQGGLKINSLTDSVSHFGAYPILNATYDVVEDRLRASAGVKGGMQYLQMYNIIEENRYVDRSADIRAMADRFHLYAGIDGQIAKNLNYSLRGYTKTVKNKLIFFNPEGGAYFQMLYDSSFTQSGAEVSLIFNKDDKIRAGLKGDFRTFKTSNVSHNFNIPNTRVDLWASYNFAKKVWITTEVFIYGPRTMSVDSLGAEINQGITADINLSADYRFTERISVFLELNNILGNDWQRWYNYRERPFDVRGGVTVSF